MTDIGDLTDISYSDTVVQDGNVSQASFWNANILAVLKSSINLLNAAMLAEIGADDDIANGAIKTRLTALESAVTNLQSYVDQAVAISSGPTFLRVMLTGGEQTNMNFAASQAVVMSYISSTLTGQSPAWATDAEAKAGTLTDKFISPATLNLIATLIRNLSWQDEVDDELDFTSAEPASPADGDRYINTATGTSSETATSVTENYIYEWDDDQSLWVEIIPEDGTALWIVDTTDWKAYNGSAWVNLGTLISLISGGSSSAQQTQVQIRKDTAANWTSNDPTLSAGEFGYETDTGYLKIGDGSTAWTSLAYTHETSLDGGDATT